MSKRNVFCVLVLMFACLVSVQLFGQSNNDKAGSVGMKFLTFAADARGAALGEAYTSLVDNASAFFWNPGALGKLDNVSAHFTWSEYLVDTQYFSAAIAYPLKNFATVTIGVMSVDYGDIVETTFDGTESFKRTGNILNPTDLAIGVSLAKRLTDKFSVGGTVKFIREDLITADASGVAFDVGTIFDTGYRNIKIGATFTNFGPDVSFTGDDGFAGRDIPIPQSFRIGVSTDSKGFSENEDFVATLSMDLIKNADTEQRLAIGGELDLLTYIQARGGYVAGFDESKISYGGGLHFDWDGKEVRADFTISSFDDFDATEVKRFSISFNF